MQRVAGGEPRQRRAGHRPTLRPPHPLRAPAQCPQGAGWVLHGGRPPRWDTDMVALVEALLEEQARRRAAGDPRWRIPMRPDHGHELLDDVGKPTHPGYPAIGRLKGLAELRGVMLTVATLRDLPL